MWLLDTAAYRKLVKLVLWGPEIWLEVQCLWTQVCWKWEIGTTENPDSRMFTPWHKIPKHHQKEGQEKKCAFFC